MPKKAEGLEKYEPSRIEWLILQLNSNFQYVSSGDSHFNLYYRSGGEDNTVCVTLLYSPGMDKEVRNKLIDLGKQSVVACAEFYGWDSWVEIETDTEEVQLER